MTLTFRELSEYIGDRIFPYYSGLLLRRIDENGDIVANVPEWYRYIFKDENDTTCENVLIRKYGSMIVDDSVIEDYDTKYKTFLQYVNESMLRYWDLFTQHNNPYHNVDEDTTITNTYGETVTTSDIDERKTTQNFDATKSTENLGKYGQDSTTLKNTDKSVIDTDARQDVTSSDSAQDKITVSTHTDTLHTVRGGNIGVTTNKTLAFEHLDYASMMKLYDMFLSEYLAYFGCGVWGC